MKNKSVPNLALKAAIVLSGRMQLQVARSARISETRLSHIVRGDVTPMSTERQRIAKALQKNELDLFPEVDS